MQTDIICYLCVAILGAKFKHCAESRQGSEKVLPIKRLFHPMENKPQHIIKSQK